MRQPEKAARAPEAKARALLLELGLASASASASRAPVTSGHAASPATAV